MSNFTINFFEFSCLVEACIPPVPIARSIFWEKVINGHYCKMTPSERTKLYEWILRNHRFDLKDKDCEWFERRFNPENQYLVTTIYEGKEEVHKCFKAGERYHTSISRSIQERYITKVEHEPAQH